MWTEKLVDRESQQKLYVQIYSIIKEKIDTHELQFGAQIPTEDELCRTYDVSKATVRTAISEMVRNGYLKKQQGKGTFVTSSLPDLGLAMKTRLTEDMFGEGVKAKKEVVTRGPRRLSEEMKALLRCDGDHERNAYYILCKRVVNDEPAYLEESFLPLSVLPGIESEDLCGKPFYDLIQEKGTRKISKVVQTIEVSEVCGETASLLRVRDGAPSLLLHRLLIGSDASCIAYTRLLGIGTKYKIQTEFERIR